MFIIYAERPLQYRSFPHSCDLFNLYPSSTDLDKSLELDSFSPWKAYTTAHLCFSLHLKRKKEYQSEYKNQLSSSRLKKINACLWFGVFLVWVLFGGLLVWFFCLFFVLFLVFCLFLGFFSDYDYFKVIKRSIQCQLSVTKT